MNEIAHWWRGLSYSSSAILEPLTGGNQVCGMEQTDDRIFGGSVAEGAGVALGRAVVAAHVPADCHGFLVGEGHVLHDKVDALFAVPVGKGVVEVIRQIVLPLGLAVGPVFACLSGLERRAIYIYFAHIVEEGANGSGFFMFVK